MKQLTELEKKLVSIATNTSSHTEPTTTTQSMSLNTHSRTDVSPNSSTHRKSLKSLKNVAHPEVMNTQTDTELLLLYELPCNSVQVVLNTALYTSSGSDAENFTLH